MLRFEISGQSLSKQPNTKLSWSKFDQSLLIMLDLLEAGSANLLSEIKSCGRWSDMVVVILLEIAFEMELLNKLSRRALE